MACGAMFDDLWMRLQFMVLQFEVVRDLVGVVRAGLVPFCGPQTGPKSTRNDPDRTLDNFKLQPRRSPKCACWDPLALYNVGGDNLTVCNRGVNPREVQSSTYCTSLGRKPEGGPVKTWARAHIRGLVSLCPGFALDRRSRTSPDDPYDTYERQ